MSDTAFDPKRESYDDLEEAVMATPRGRWFLREHAKRQKAADTEVLLDKLNHIKNDLIQYREESRVELLRKELNQMADSIAQTRSDIAAIRSDDVASDKIVDATGELDAIVNATENATSEILASAEKIQTVSDELRKKEGFDEICDILENEVMSIFTACSFQDLTGQRTNKVVNTLRYLEQRVNAMIQIWDEGGGGDARPDAAILEGPQMEGEGFSQDEIDAFLDGDLSVVDEDELEEASKRVEAVDRAVEEMSQKRRDQDVDTSAAKPAEQDKEVSPSSDEAFDQDDIDSLFG